MTRMPHRHDPARPGHRQRHDGQSDDPIKPGRVSGGDRRLPGPAMPKFAVHRQIFPNIPAPGRHAVQQIADVIVTWLPEPVVLHKRTHRHEIDRRHAKQPKQAWLHHRAPMRQPELWDCAGILRSRTGRFQRSRSREANQGAPVRRRAASESDASSRRTPASPCAQCRPVPRSGDSTGRRGANFYRIRQIQGRSCQAGSSARGNRPRISGENSPRSSQAMGQSKL
jgi:hypothetical protein